jgi:hypothetical protein
MKYNIGDIVKIKKLKQVDYVIYQNRVGIILEQIAFNEDIDYDYTVPCYRILIAGIEGKKHFVYEDEIEYKIE